MRHRGAVLVSVLGALVACSSSNGGSGDGTCPAYCSDACQMLVTCKFAIDSSCVSDCEVSVGTDVCGRLRPISQYTCAEVQQLYMCGSYCEAFCQRIPTCGAFDGAACLRGCGKVKPIVCNPASVAARTCDQLKPEGRTYDEAANATGGFSAFASPGAYGLCETAGDCAGGQICVAATNTCAPCQSDTDCTTQATGTQCVGGACQ